MVTVPEGSLYFWCYEMGLKHIQYQDILDAVLLAGRELRKKDIENYWNGWFRSDLYQRTGDSVWSVGASRQSEKRGILRLSEYPEIPHEYWRMPQNRWVPCSSDNKPLIKWGNGCLTLPDACAFSKQVYLAENNKGIRRVIIDCDGDHDERLNLETIMFLGRFIDKTHTLYKEVMVTDVPGYEGTGINLPVSFHLSFKVARIIPTMHFQKAGIDVIGNKENSLRYLKTKKWNGIHETFITDDEWSEICEFIKWKEGKA